MKRQRVKQLLRRARDTRILVVGDVMLDHFVWGRVDRISPEAPVPVVEFSRESLMPGGAANVGRNLTALGIPVRLFSVIGRDESGDRLRELLEGQAVDCGGMIRDARRQTSIKTRVIAHQQQVVRVDRETRGEISPARARRLVRDMEPHLDEAAAVIVGDYGKGIVTQALLEALKLACRKRGLWISLDPKPIHQLNLEGLSLITPNRKEAFELAGMTDGTRAANPLEDPDLMTVAERLLAGPRPALLLITLGEQGMLLCQRGAKPFHIPTTAQEVFDVSGAGDTVIASFTLAVAAGASPLEAAIVSNHAGGIVVGKVGTATVGAAELLDSFPK